MTPETAKSFLDGAPIMPIENPDIKGYWFEDGYYICGHCAARIMARGCGGFTKAQPVWIDRPEPFGVCIGCEIATN
jgi:hypothetical protein